MRQREIRGEIKMFFLDISRMIFLFKARSGALNFKDDFKNSRKKPKNVVFSRKNEQNYPFPRIQNKIKDVSRISRISRIARHPVLLF